MLLSFLIILLTTLGGTILTYAYNREDALAVRLAAGNIIGATFFGLNAFTLACAFGFSPLIVWLAAAFSLAPLILLKNKQRRNAFAADLSRAKEQMEGANAAKFLNFAYFIALTILFCVFFNRAMFETPDGIFTGGSNNLGDLPFHLGAIFSFTEGNNFPPENPSFAFAKFTYPFMADLIAACFVKLGANAADAFLVQNVTLALSLVVLLEKFAFSLTGSRRAGKVACLLLLFSGGLGFVVFFKEYWSDGRELLEFVWHLPEDYTIRRENWRWGNSLTTLFLTQRGLLLGMPLVLIVLTKIWELFRDSRDAPEIGETDEREAADFDFNSLLPYLFAGILAGTLPLVHVHSLAVLFVVSAFLFFLSLDKWREWIAFGAAVAVIAVPELVWTLTGSASNVGKFVGWHFGWDSGESNIIVFWAKNLGLFAPLLVISLFFLNKFAARNEKRAADSGESEIARTSTLLLFYAPFALLFVISNIFKLAPWEWDNIKLLIYWFAASLPFVAGLLVWLWEKSAALKIIAALCFAGLIFSGALDVWRTISRQINYSVFSRDALNVAAQLKAKTAPTALFLNAPSYNSPVVLTGRRSFMRYIAHLGSYGIDYEPRYNEVKRIYEGTALAAELLRKNQIDYVVVSHEDDGWVRINDQFFEKYPLIAESGAYRVYQVK